MKKILEILALMLLLSTVFTFVPVGAVNPTIKIGVIGPQGLPHWSPFGMKEGAELARDEINAAGGVDVDGTMYDIELLFANEHSIPEPDTPSAVAAMEDLITVRGAQYIIGGFRTEVVGAMINKSMDHKVPFFIDGASTDELVTPLVAGDYAKYKYLFRVTPVNSTMLFSTIVAFLKTYAIPNVLLPIYGQDLDGNPATPDQVRVAVLTEDLAWTATMHFLFTNPAYYPSFLGPHANVTYSARVPATMTDFSSYMTAVKNSGARLMIHIFSGTAGLYLMNYWAAMGVQALPMGINVFAQLGTYWAMTGGASEFENVLNFAGTRTPIVPGYTEVFWDNFVAKTGGWPIYTAWGAYDAIYGLKEAIETAGTLDADTLVPVLEATDRTSLSGRFRYTSTHDVYMSPLDLGPIHTGNVRVMMIQWQRASADGSEGRMEVVYPNMTSYSRMIRLPSVMYPLLTDINYDGKVDIRDIASAAKAFGSYPGHPEWRMEADLPPTDGKIDIRDIARIARDFGQSVTLPLP